VAGRRRAPGQKTNRPRDELGRLLPWGAENRLRMEDFDALSPEENHRLAIEHFNAGRYFPAHEAWETVWKQRKGSPDEEFFKGLSQLGAGYVHWRRGNAHGAHTLLRRALSRVRGHAPRHQGLDVEDLVRVAEGHVEAFEGAERAGEEIPEIAPLRIRPG
jgi:predicted metal-dependent hydrolase